MQPDFDITFSGNNHYGSGIYFEFSISEVKLVPGTNVTNVTTI